MNPTSTSALIADRFGLGRHAVLDGPVASGRLGDIWRLVTDSGRFAVKLARSAVSADDAEADAAYQDAVRRRGVPMPAVIRTVEGAVLADVAGSQVRIYEWVDILPPDRRLDPAGFGRLLAAIHAVRVPTEAPVDGWYVDPGGEALWHDLAARLRAAGAPFADRLMELLPDVLEAENILAPPLQVQVCHRDLWADNVRSTPAGTVVVLDWENCGPGDVNGELACALFEYGLDDPRRMRSLHDAYVDAGGPGRLQHREDLTMLVAQLGHIARLGCERWLSSTTDRDRSSNAAWVREFLDAPVTLDTVDRILAAARQRRDTDPVA